MIASVSRVPVYCLWDFSLGYGAWGASDQRSRAGLLQLPERSFAISAVPLSGLPVRYEPVTVPKFDWKMLEKFKINPAMLPEGAFLQGRPASITDQFRENG